MTADATFLEKFLPVQPILSMYYQGPQEGLIEALYGATLHYGGAGSPLQEFKVGAPPDFPPESNMSNVALLQFLRFLVALKRPKRVLEIGTFLGISAMTMATHLPKGGQLVTLEKFALFAGHARANVEANGLQDRIQVLEGDADEVIRRGLPDAAYDLVFLDGNKEKYLDYFRLVDPLIPMGGVLVVDDVFFQGDVLNPEPTTDKGRGAKACLEAARIHPGYAKALLPLGDGVLLMTKTEASA